MPSVTKCHCIRSPTDFSGCWLFLIWTPRFGIWEQNEGKIRDWKDPRDGMGGMNGKIWIARGDWIEDPYWGPLHITILTCARIQLLVRIGSLGSCDNNDSCLRNVNNLFNKSPLQRLKWKKKKKRFSWSFYVNHKNFFSKNVQCLAAILPNTLCKPIYPMSLWDGLRIPARGKYCPQDFPPATMNIIPDRLYCYRKHKETRAKRYS